MKIYVVELPKCCRECGFCCKDDLGYWCQGLGDGGVYILDEILKEKRLGSCPLQTTQSLKQQVREEVVEEIKKIADSIFARYENRELDDVAYGELVCCNILIKKFQRKEGNEQC